MSKEYVEQRDGGFWIMSLDVMGNGQPSVTLS